MGDILLCILLYIPYIAPPPTPNHISLSLPIQHKHMLSLYFFPSKAALRKQSDELGINNKA